MKKWYRRSVKWILTSLAVLIMLVGVTMFISLKTMAQSGDNTLQELRDAGLEPVEQKIPFDSFMVNTVRIGDLSKPKILFIHGSPGDWSVFSQTYLDSAVNSSYCLIAYDRPGYGKTSIPAEPNLARQASVAKAVIDAYASNEKYIVVGHSYGGGVVSQLLVDYPEVLEKAIMAAPALAPAHQEPRWYNKAANWRWLNRIIGDDLRASNIEMIGLAPSLRTITADLQNIQVQQVFIHGKRDKLVPFETVDYWKQYVDENYVEYVLKDDMGHLIPFRRAELISEAILP